MTATQMAQAITFVAARARVPRRPLPASRTSRATTRVARTGLFDEAKCAANARAYAAQPDVVAVIGTLNSPCAVAALPELNRAPGGPARDGLAAQLLRRPDARRAAASTRRCRRRSTRPGAATTSASSPPTTSGRGARAARARPRPHDASSCSTTASRATGRCSRDGFAAARRAVGLDVAGRATWDPRRAAYAGSPARRRARARAPSSSAGCSTRTPRGSCATCGRALGAGVDILGPDGLTPLPLLVRRPGRRRDGHVRQPGGVVTERSRRRRARSCERFARTQPGVAGRALRRLRRPGGRGAARRDRALRRDARLGARELFRTRVAAGLLGSIRASTRAATSPRAPVTVLRVIGGGEGPVEGGTVERVVRPPVRLVE